MEQERGRGRREVVGERSNKDMERQRKNVDGESLTTANRMQA